MPESFSLSLLFAPVTSLHDIISESLVYTLHLNLDFRSSQSRSSSYCHPSSRYRRSVFLSCYQLLDLLLPLHIAAISNISGVTARCATWLVSTLFCSPPAASTKATVYHCNHKSPTSLRQRHLIARHVDNTKPQKFYPPWQAS